MNSPISQGCSKDVAKQLEYVKQQQQLREIGCVKNNSNSKVLSADSMIEELLSKKETFQKRNPESQQKQETTVGLPPWLSSTPPPLFRQVWHSVQTAGGLADTPLLSSVLLTSGLPTDTLGYIWSLANHTVPGALTQAEVYLVLALVGLAQAGYVVSSLEALYQVPQAPLPTLDLALLSAKKQQVYPNTLNVTNLPDTLSYNWTSDIANPTYSGQIGVSYVSSGPMISPNLITDQHNKSSVNMNIVNKTVTDNIPAHNNTVNYNSKMNVGVPKSNSDTKRSDNAHSFSFPILNDSPSHVNASHGGTDSFDDEFTDFQSADFSTISPVQQTETNLRCNDDDDEFSNFQNASPNYNSDDLSVLVIGGKIFPSAQQLWVADNSSLSHQKDKCCEIAKTGEIFSTSSNVLDEGKPTGVYQSDINEEKNSLEIKYEAFQEIDDDKYSVFYNPLPDDEIKQNVMSSIAMENMQMETKSIFQHSLFEDPDPSLHPSQNIHKIQNLDPPKCQIDQLNSNNIKEHENDDDDDEYSNFQDCPITFSDSSNAISSQNVDKYDVFRTIIFKDTFFQEDALQKIKTSDSENVSQIQSFESEMSDISKGTQLGLFANNSETASLEFNDIQEPVIQQSSNNSNIDSLFSSLMISDRNNEIDNNSDTSFDLGPIEDKYKALRILEPSDVEVDDFGEFLGAELPNSGNEPRKLNDLNSVQIRCLEACLSLMKDGVSKLSQGSTPEVMSEVLSDSRTSAYLDCLLEVHRVSQRIINQLNCDACVSIAAELHETWGKLESYFKHSEHNPMAEVVGAVCGICRSNTGPSPVTFGAQSFHTPCANLYLHCVEPVLPNKAATLVQ